MTVVTTTFLAIAGFAGADVAWPISGESGGALPNGSTIKNTHHQSNI